MWWIIDVAILATFSIMAGNRIGDELYVHFGIPYSALKDIKLAFVAVMGVLSALYMAFRLYP